MKIGKKLGALLAIIMTIGIAWVVQANTAAIGQSTPWTTAGSTGTVDDEDYKIAGLSGGIVYAKTSGTLDIRYNIVALPGLEAGDGPMMTLRYIDVGAGSRVVTRLKEYNIYTGVQQTLMQFDSNNYAPGRNYQTRSISKCSWDWAYDFNNNVYYIETSMTRNNSINPSAAVALAGINLGGTIC